MSVKFSDILHHNGEAHTLTEWCDIKGITISTVKNRLERGWSVADALETPGRARAKKKHTPCSTCEWWKPLSSYTTAAGCCCHLYLETGRHRGMNEDETECTTWEERTGKRRKKVRPM